MDYSIKAILTLGRLYWILKLLPTIRTICIDPIQLLACQEALGMENGAILDEQITASSQSNSDHAPFQGRLHFQKSWTAGTTNLHQWLQVDLGSQYTKVTRVATQGRNDAAQWVTKYKLSYSDDGVNFQYHKEQGQTTAKVW